MGGEPAVTGHIAPVARLSEVRDFGKDVVGFKSIPTFFSTGID